MNSTITMKRAAAPRNLTDTGLVTATLQVATQVLRKFVRSPQLIIVGTAQGALFLLIFRYVFGGAITLQHIDYVNFVVPGFVTTGVLFTGMYATTGIAEDMQSGLIARLDRSRFPAARSYWVGPSPIQSFRSGRWRLWS